MTLLPECLDDYVGQDNPVRVVEAFVDQLDLRRMGFDERFKRMWDFYLASCAGAFEGGNCDVTQITVTRPS